MSHDAWPWPILRLNGEIFSVDATETVLTSGFNPQHTLNASLVKRILSERKTVLDYSRIFIQGF